MHAFQQPRENVYRPGDKCVCAREGLPVRVCACELHVCRCVCVCMPLCGERLCLAHILREAGTRDRQKKGSKVFPLHCLFFISMAFQIPTP